MSDGSISRREFLRYGAAATAAGMAAPFYAGAEEPPKADTAKPSLRVLLHGPDGQPLKPGLVKTMIARDMAGDPLPVGITNSAGESRVELASEPIQLCCRLDVPGFGEVYCYADNGGKGYTTPTTIDFVIDAARTRLRRVRERADREPELFKFYREQLEPIPNRPGLEIQIAYLFLAALLTGGEGLVKHSAERRISRMPSPRKDFFFGAAVSGRDRSPEFSDRFTAAFNFATISWYIWGKEQPESAQIEYSRMDQALQWCLDRHITPKGFGYVYLTKGATPEWLRSYPYEKLLPLYQRVVEQTMRRYDGRMPYAEIINEAHDKSNLFRLNHAQILELTRESCRAARAGSPQVKRQINNCCMWAEYAKHRNQDGSRRWSPYRYLADCVKSNVEFERIGLQLYYPEQDLLEIERMLDRFKDFKRPIHISEISCSSAPGPDKESMRPDDPAAGWHGPWTETMQADWLEAIYTLCYSKPEFEVVGWWDVADYPSHFWPNGGLLRKDFTPKESYFRLLKLKRDWGLSV